MRNFLSPIIRPTKNTVKKLTTCLLPYLCSFSLCLSTSAQPPAPAETPTALGWQPGLFGTFVMALCRDNNGGIWVGTEEKGVWRFDPQGRSWKQWTTKDGLGDDYVYALACDKKGRIWAGHLNHGVSVWNGTGRWKNYDVFSGPLGERTFDIEVSPLDGDVWIATNSGLARYHAEREWLYYHRGTGLPADQVSALSFDSKGKLYAGTHCDGIAIATPDDRYATWKQVLSPFPKMPFIATGRGLPGNFINDVLATRDGSVYAATKNGLARSNDGGESWAFLRGENWSARVDGLYDNPKAPEAVVSAEPLKLDTPLLAEDDVTSLAEDTAGRLWIGYFRKGCEARDIKTNRRIYSSQQDTINNAPDESIRAFLPQPGAIPAALLARYGGANGGLGRVGKPVSQTMEQPALPPAPYPQTAALPDAAHLKSLLDKVSVAPAVGSTYLGADWATQGNWPGRYGQQTGALCGIQSPITDIVNPTQGYKIDSGVGPHFKDYDSIYTYVHWLKSDLRQVLFQPRNGVRRQAEWNDGTWQPGKYPPAREGPDLWATVTVADGPHRVALYFFNKDGHTGPNRFRDYVVELKKHDDDRIAADASPTLAQGRVRDFWGGVYLNFQVQGPSTFDFKIARQGSHVTMMSGVFINRLDAVPGFGKFAPPVPETVEGETQPIVQLWETAQSGDPRWRREAQIQAYRALSATKKYPDLLAHWRWQSGLWTADDHDEFEDYMARTAQEVAARKAAAAAKPNATPN